MSFSTSFFLKKQKKDKNNTVPIYCRISTGAQDRVEYYTKIRIDPVLWLKQPKRYGNGMTQYIKGSIEKIKSYNKTLNLIESKIQEKYNQLLAEGTDITADELKSLLINKESDKATLISMMEKLRERRNTSSSKKTIDYYITAIQLFLRHKYKVDDVDVRALNQRKYRGLGAELVEWGKQKKWSQLYTKSILDIVKSAVNIAIEFYYIDNNPIRYSFSIKSSEVKQKDTLTFQEVISLEKASFSKKHLLHTRDVFLFQIYTGLSYIDVKTLRKEHITRGIDGKNWIIKKREKTKSVAKIPLIDKAQDLLDKYFVLEGQVLPVVHRSAYNRNLKTMATLLDIKKSLSSHCGRHTFATLMRESGSDLSNLKQIVAHSQASMTEHYAKLTPGTLSEEMDKLEKKMGS